MHLTTNLGLIDINLNSAAAPCAANSFRSLSHFKYFAGTPCHRLTTQGIYVVHPDGTGLRQVCAFFGGERRRSDQHDAQQCSRQQGGQDPAWCELSHASSPVPAQPWCGRVWSTGAW